MRCQIAILFSLVLSVWAGFVKVTLGESGNCKKYVSESGMLQVSAVKLLFLNKNHKIIRIIACKMGQQTSNIVTATCNENYDPREAKVLLSIRAVSDVLYAMNDIEYRYNENAMRMIQYKTYNPEKSQKRPFNAKAHLYIRKLEVKGDGTDIVTYDAGDNGCFTSWPNYMIADHGIYTFVDKVGYTRVYFDPAVPGEYLMPN
uniref:Uncharacterized protein n=1 Tax=Caenorhabditis japonica TaxID=281687 RepID=A0A8R1DVM4_CAEJA